MATVTKKLGMPAAPVKKTAKGISATITKSAKSCPPLYFDVAYIPTEADGASIDAEFFQRVCAPRYVLSCAEPTRQLLDSILDGKRSQLADGILPEGPDTATVIIPTYETTELVEWLRDNSTELHRLNVEFAASANRCIIELQGPNVDTKNQCRAYRLEF
jgi:hypothetical protein